MTHHDPQLASDELNAFAERWLLRLARECMPDLADQIGVTTRFAELGVTSVLAVQLVGQVEAELGVELDATLLFDYHSVALLARYLCSEQTAAMGALSARTSHTDGARRAPPSPDESTAVNARTSGELAPLDPTRAVAVIGLACRFPDADDATQFWQNLRAERDSVSEVPAQRFDIETWYDADPNAPSRTYCRHGGWLDRSDAFDAEFFRISGREAETMAPQQRLFLEVAWHALEDAGYAGKRASEATTGVFVGVVSSEHALSALLDQQLGKNLHEVVIEATMATGEAMSLIANRLSYALDLSGPSLALDTACSSSLVSVHLACQSLLADECDLALAAGVNVGIGAARYVAFSKARMFSVDGHCKPFDARADGYVCGEGVGAVVLKRLDRALADGDRISAVIRGSAMNQDGATNGLTAPNALAQQRVIMAAQRRAGVSPESISYIECHGTGTALGDPIEFRALKEVFAAPSTRKGYCGVGSVKSNIGHLEGAAGIASFIKVVQSLVHRELPATLHFTGANPRIDFVGSPFYLVSRSQPWKRDGVPLRAGISSFGFGGTNCHVILEEAPAPSPAEFPVAPARGFHLLTLSAPSQSGLDALSACHETMLGKLPDTELASACHTSNVGRAELPQRLAIVAATAREMADKLAKRQGAAGRATGEHLRVALLFTGQGAQYSGMAASLYAADARFRADFEQCASILQPHLEGTLSELVFHQGSEARLQQTQFTQPVTFVIEYCIARWWGRLGLRPAALIGHSLGEYTAACIAGVFGLEQALSLVAQRARLMQQAPGRGAMAAVLADRTRVEALIAALPALEIAACNSPSNFVITGEEAAIEAALALAPERGLRAVRLPVSHAFHSRMMDSILPQLSELFAKVEFGSPSLRVISNHSGQPATTELATPEYWLRQVREPVLYSAGIDLLQREGISIFLEVGPGQTLCNLARESSHGTANHASAQFLPSLLRGRDAWDSLLNAVAALWTAGVPLDLSAIEGLRTKMGALPHYPFQRRAYSLRWQPIPTPQAKISADVAPQPPAARRTPRPDVLNDLRLGRRSVAGTLSALLGTDHQAPREGA